MSLKTHKKAKFTAYFLPGLAITVVGISTAGVLTSFAAGAAKTPETAISGFTRGKLIESDLKIPGPAGRQYYVVKDNGERILLKLDRPLPPGIKVGTRIITAGVPIDHKTLLIPKYLNGTGFAEDTSAH